MSRVRDEAVADLWAYVSARPHEWLSIPDVAYALGRSPGKQFGLDLRAVRSLALSKGHCVTFCEYSHEVEGFAFRFLPEGQEQGMSAGPLEAQERHVRTRMEHLHGQAEWAARNAVSPEEQALAHLQARLAKDAANSLAATAEFREAMERIRRQRNRDDDEGGANP